MKPYLLFIGLLGLLGSLNAQITTFYGVQADQVFDQAEEVSFKTDSDLPIYVQFNEKSAPSLTGFFSKLKAEFELPNEYTFELRNSYTDQLGIEHNRYYQLFNGVRVEMAWLNVHLKNDQVLSFNGNLSAKGNLPQTKTISSAAALQSSLNDMGANTYKWEIPAEEMHLKQIEGDPTATYYPQAELAYMNTSLDFKEDLRLCHKFNIYAADPLARLTYYLDAESGEIVYIEQMIHTTDKPGTAVTAYSGTVTITTDSVGSYYRLRETGRGQGIETYDMNNGTNYSSAVDFIDSNNFWNAFNPAINRYATDAHLGTEKTYDYFQLVHNRSSIDGNGFPLRSYVHYDQNYVNAFWDGQRMTYGDGDAIYSPLTTLDICGHEVAHGFTDFTSDLIYANESGALNESFSDIFGAAVENFARPGNWNWLIGEDIGAAFRSMSDPNRFGDPDTYDGLNWIDQNCIPTRGNDYCGVHSNSGVQNYWFFLLSEGRSGVNDLGNSFNVSGIGIIQAGRVAYRNNAVYLGRSSDHDEARFYAIKSAIDLFGACSPEVESVTNAWHAVGVGLPYSPGVSAEFAAVKDTSFCALPARVEFNSVGNNVINFNWDFGNGNSSTQADPVQFYTTAGSYDVQLIVDGGNCGADTIIKTNYIIADTALACSYFFGTDQMITECSGNLYDDGGLNGAYNLNNKDTIVLAPNSADQIILYFNDFEMEAGDESFCNKDYLEVYDGGLNDRIIGKYCGNNLPPDSIISSSNKLSLIFNSDRLSAFQGIKCRFECLTATAPPTADFYTPIDSLCSAEVNFYDRSTGGMTSWFWDFGDGNTSTEKNPSHFYERDGSYNVSLRVTNSFGSDQITKNNVIHIQRLAAPSVSNDTACVNGRIKLGAGNGSNNRMNWYAGPSSEQLMFFGDTLRINNFQRDTAFYVEYEQRPAAIIGTPFQINGNGHFSDSSEAIYFNVYESCMLESVILNSNRIGPRRFDLRNSQGEIIATKTINVSGVPSQVQIGFKLNPGYGYSLSIGSSNPSLYMNTSGASYPYTMGPYMELTGSSLGPNAYPFFYYWTIRPLTCKSNRARAEGKVDTSCVLVGLDEGASQAEKLIVFPNPSSNGFSIAGLKQMQASVQLQIMSIEGKLIQNLRFSNGNQLQSEEFGLDLPPAVYFIQIDYQGRRESLKWVKTQ